MTLDHLTTKTLGVSAAVVAEVAAIQTSTSPAEWALKNAGLLLAIAGGVFAYGRLHQRVEALREIVASKASNEKVDAIDKKLDAIHGDVRSLTTHLLGDRK